MCYAIVANLGLRPLQQLKTYEDMELGVIENINDSHIDTGTSSVDSGATLRSMSWCRMYVRHNFT